MSLDDNVEPKQPNKFQDPVETPFRKILKPVKRLSETLQVLYLAFFVIIM